MHVAAVTVRIPTQTHCLVPQKVLFDLQLMELEVRAAVAGSEAEVFEVQQCSTAQNPVKPCDAWAAVPVLAQSVDSHLRSWEVAASSAVAGVAAAVLRIEVMGPTVALDRVAAAG